MEVHNILQEALTKIIQKKKKCKKAKWLSEEALQIALQGKIYPTDAEFQRKARRDKKAFWSEV